MAPHSTNTSPSRSAPATICSHRASTAPTASTAPVPRTCPTPTPNVSTRGIRSTVTPQSAQAVAFHPVPSNNGRVVTAVA
ncbi:Uncharacterised protein [Mycobacterium tuberculosis]|nr:Uncharacterised protein [Mycobacterium tuberculosis]